MDTAEILKLVATTTFSPFDTHDWDCFSGCESENPLIAYAGDYTVLIDGDKIVLIDEEGDESMFKLGGDLFA